MICERCGAEIYRSDTCNYCNKKICNNCIKNSKKISRTEKLIICKDCWSNMKKRSKHKSAKKEA